MDAKKVYLVAGLPRSGSTLLMNILGQNPKHYVTPSSGILDILVQIRNNWDANPMFRSWDINLNEIVKENVMRGILYSSFDHTDKPICFDKNRGWPAFFEMAEVLLKGRENIKCLVLVRDLRDVVASFEKLFRSTSALSRIPQDDDPNKMRTGINRVQVFLAEDEIIQRAYNTITDAVLRGWHDVMLFINYDNMTRNPGSTFSKIYEFLGEEPFEHDFNHVEQITYENDKVHGFKDLHIIRNKVEPLEPQWPKIFSREILLSDAWQNVARRAQFWKGFEMVKQI